MLGFLNNNLLLSFLNAPKRSLIRLMVWSSMFLSNGQMPGVCKLGNLTELTRLIFSKVVFLAFCFHILQVVLIIVSSILALQDNITCKQLMFCFFLVSRLLEWKTTSSTQREVTRGSKDWNVKNVNITIQLRQRPVNVTGFFRNRLRFKVLFMNNHLIQIIPKPSVSISG